MKFILAIVLLFSFGCSKQEYPNSLKECIKVIQYHNIGKHQIEMSYQENWGNSSDPEYHYSWGKGSIKGNKKMSAYCSVSKVTGKVTTITINGKRPY